MTIFFDTPKAKFLFGTVMGFSLLVAVTQVAAQPTQYPLMSRDGGGVKPNIMLTMDDSGSMMFQHMPETTIYVGAYSVASPVGSNSVRMDPGDNAYLDAFFIGTVASQPGTTNYRQKLMRSPDTNTIYYNPEVRYNPWPLAAGGRMANSPVASAYRNPMNTATGGTINLTNVRVVDTTWCYRDSRTDCNANDETYDPGLYFRLKKTAGAYMDPTVAANYDQFTINAADGTTFTKYPARTDCAGTVCTKTEERQNYANWFTYYRTRNLLARGAVAEAFNDSGNTFRLGWGRINDDTSTSIDGVNSIVIRAGVRDFTDAIKADLFTWIYALPADGGTPLPRAMRTIGEYYKRADNRGPWSDNPGTANTTADKACRRAYHLLVTDGYWSGSTTSVGNSDNTDGAVITGPGRNYQYDSDRPYRDSNSDTLADYAMEYWKTDLRTDLANIVEPSAENPAFWQHMVNFTVGLGVRGTLDPGVDLPALTAGTKTWGTDKIDDLWHAALNSRGNYISAKDPKELAEAIRNSVGQALTRELREAGVATASTTLQAGNRKYVPLYRSGDWNGDIQAFVLDALGQAGAQSWNAEAKVPVAASRNIYTWRTDTAPASAAVFTWAAMGTDNQTALGAVAATHTTDFVNFLRGNRSKEGDGQPFRERRGVLGDFVNSNPVLVKDAVNLGYINLPAAQGGGTPYSTFLTQKAARSAVLFVGGNDGMLHAFKDTLGAVPADDGKEIFAYVPRSVYPNLSKLADKTYGTTALYHQYFVDGPLNETDAYVRAPADTAASWRNYLLGTLGAGGRAVFALDITNSSSMDGSSIRWEISNLNYPDIGYITAPIQAGVLPNGEWVAIFGNGRFSDAGNAVLFVVNLETGVAQTMTVDATGSNALGGVALVRNSSGQVTGLYAGDLKGKLWKFDYSAIATSRFLVSGGAPFFSATSSGGTPQPITQAPAVFDTTRGGKMVLFGTGVLDVEAEADSTDVQSIYSVWDKEADTIPRPMDRTVLSTRTLSTVAGSGGATFYSIAGTSVNWTAERGWVLDLSAIAGLRLIYPPQKATSKVALMSTISPARNLVVCEASVGSGVNFYLESESGVNPNTPMYDTNGDGVVNTSDTSVVGYATNADGIDAIVRGEMGTGTGIGGGAAGKCPPGTRMISTQNTTGQMMVCVPDPTDDATSTRTIQDRVWRRIINPPIR
jgi:type IV pilus assembly protein PilY1